MNIYVRFSGQAAVEPLLWESAMEARASFITFTKGYCLSFSNDVMSSGMRDADICARCADDGASCCRLESSASHICFPISVMEWERILDVAGEQGAFVQEPNSPPFVDAMRRYFPMDIACIDALFPHHKFHLRLAATSDGACVFLGSNGCALPQETRPYYCRLFPFWMEGDFVRLIDAPSCLALRVGGFRNDVMALMTMRESDVRTLHGRLRLAWGLAPRPGMAVAPPAFARSRPTS